MIRGASGLIAHQLETVAGVITRPLYSNKNLFVVDGAPGVWRQVANPNVSDPSDKGIVYAAFGGGKISLTFDVLVNAELDLAGFARVVDPATVPGELSAIIGGAITTAKRLAAESPPTLLTTAAEEAAEAGRAPATDTAPRAPRRRAAGSAITGGTLPSVTQADGTPLPGSLAAEGLGADTVLTPAPSPSAPAGDVPPPEETGFAPAGELEI